MAGRQMGYSMYGMAVAMVFVAGVGAYSAIERGAAYKPAKASVATIDRTCDFVETTYEGKKAKSARGYSDACNSTDEWATIREKRNKKVSGRAVVHVTYTAPQDGSYRTSELRFDGRDDEFYQLKAGDEIDVLVSNSDPSKIRKS
jgi:hypothetical protein